jgi:hypothetical protein
MGYLQGSSVYRFCRSIKTVIYREVVYTVFAGATNGDWCGSDPTPLD